MSTTAYNQSTHEHVVDTTADPILPKNRLAARRHSHSIRALFEVAFSPKYGSNQQFLLSHTYPSHKYQRETKMNVQHQEERNVVLLLVMSSALSYEYMNLVVQSPTFAYLILTGTEKSCSLPRSKLIAITTSHIVAIIFVRRIPTISPTFLVRVTIRCYHWTASRKRIGTQC